MFSNGKFKNIVAEVDVSRQIGPSDALHGVYSLLPVRGEFCSLLDLPLVDFPHLFYRHYEELDCRRRRAVQHKQLRHFTGRLKLQTSFECAKGQRLYVLPTSHVVVIVLFISRSDARRREKRIRHLRVVLCESKIITERNGWRSHAQITFHSRQH